VNIASLPLCKISGRNTAVAKLLEVGCGAKALGVVSIEAKDASLAASSIYVGGYGGPGKGTLTQAGGSVAAKFLSVGGSAGAVGYGEYHGTGGL